MQFTKRLHEPIRAGIITCSIRIWKRMHAKVGGRYRLGQGPGYIVVDSIDEISPEDFSTHLCSKSHDTQSTHSSPGILDIIPDLHPG